jgi:hypothetical protein
MENSMKFLENFSLVDLEKIDQNSLICDFFIICSSFEERCVRSSHILKLKKIKIDNSIIFNYEENDSVKKRDKNLEKLRSNCNKISKKVYQFNNCRINFPSDGMKGFKSFLFEESIDINNKNVIIDISVFTKPYFFLLTKLLTEEFGIKNFFIIYTEPEGYGKRTNNEYDLSDGIYHISHIPGFHGYSINENDALIVLLGFEGNRSLDIFYNINPDITYAVNGFPAFQPGWQMRSIELNKRFLSESGANLHLFNAPAIDPFETKRVLENIIKEINQLYPYLDIVIAPLGTKTQAFGTLLCALTNKKIRIVYPFPTHFSDKYSENYGDSWIFKINLSEAIY